MGNGEVRERTADIYGIVALDADECRAILTRQRMCVLATADGDQPYAVPIFYGFDGVTVYLGIAEGRKTEVLERNPRLCLTIAEVGPGDSWRSVLVLGRAEWIEDGAERTVAIRVMMEHNRRPERQAITAQANSPAAAGSAQRHRRGRMLRVAEAEITGRAKGPGGAG